MNAGRIACAFAVAAALAATAKAQPFPVLQGDPVDGLGRALPILPGVPLIGPNEGGDFNPPVIDPNTIGDVDLVVRAGHVTPGATMPPPALVPPVAAAGGSRFPGRHRHPVHGDRLRRRSAGAGRPPAAGSRTRLAATHYDYASLFLRKGEYNKAAEHLQSSLRITEQNFGKTHAEYFGRLVRLATCRYEQHEYSRAQETLDEAKSLQIAIFADSPHPYIARMLQLQSEILRREGKFEEALKVIDDAIAKKLIYGKEEHPSVAEALEVKVKIFHHLGEKVEAKLLIDRALEIRQNAYGEDHPDVSRSIHDLGSYYLRLGQFEAAAMEFLRNDYLFEM